MKKKALILLAVLVMGLIALFIGSRGDEPLGPAVTEVIAFRLPEVPPEDNAFIGLNGLGGLEDGDVVTAGKKYLEIDSKTSRGPEPAPQLDYSYKNPCLEWGEENCLDQILADEAIITSAFEKNSELIERYQVIQNMPSYINISDYNDRTPQYRTMMLVSQLIRDKALLDIKRGDLSGGLDVLEKDLDFYKRIAQSKYIHLMDLAMAVSQVQRCQTLLSKIIEDGRIDFSGEKERFRKMLDLDFSADRIMTAALEMENRIMLRMLHALPEEHKNDPSGEDVSWKSKLMDGLFKINMTMNRFCARSDEEIRQLRAIPMLNFPNVYRWSMASQDFEEHSGSAPNLEIKNLYKIYGLFFFKNYFGEYLLNLSRSPGLKYFGRLNDAIVSSNLIRAQLELRLMADRPEDFAGALAGLGPETWNPYTGQPFEWDQENNVLRVEMADPRDQVKARLGTW